MAPEKRRRVRRILAAACLIAVYVILDRTTFSLQIWTGISAWYPPTGLALAALIGVGAECAPVILIAEIIASIVNYHLPVGSLMFTAGNVEDNEVNERLISRLLEKMGHTVAVAENGQKAVRMWSEQEFDLVAMDMQMPIMDGLEATAEIRARERDTGRHVPIVAMTANGFDEDGERCLRGKMDGYIAKPVTAKAIEMEIARVMTAQEKIEKLDIPKTR